MKEPDRGEAMIARLFVLMLVLGLVWRLLACVSPVERTADLAQNTPTRPGASGDTGQRTPTPTVLVTAMVKGPSPTPLATSTPVPSPIPALQPLRLVDKGFGRGTWGLAYAFLLENPNEGHAATFVSYQVAAYDRAGAVLTTDQGV
jgi:hypothetical protein